jgi:hypothetical protein
MNDAVTYRIVLDEAGYYDEEATEANVRAMFADYVGAGCFRDMDLDDVEDIKTEDICAWFIRRGKVTA